MNMWEAVVVIVAVISFAKVARYRAISGFGGRRGNTGYDQPAALPGPEHQALIRENADLRRDLGELRERVQVLERIATDNRHAQSISDEIEALRGR